MWRTGAYDHVAGSFPAANAGYGRYNYYREQPFMTQYRRWPYPWQHPFAYPQNPATLQNYYSLPAQTQPLHLVHNDRLFQESNLAEPNADDKVWRLVHRRRFDKEKRHTIENLKDIYSSYKVSKWSAERKKKEIEKLNAERKNCAEWAKNEVRKQMLKKARQLKMYLRGKVVQRYSDIGRSWAKDGSNENAAIMYQILFGMYEGKEKKDWSRTLEREYMQENHMVYKDVEDDIDEGSRGCYERVITHSKGKLVKGLNNKGKHSHNKVVIITITADEEMKLKKKNWYKRGRGMYNVKDKKRYV